MTKDDSDESGAERLTARLASAGFVAADDEARELRDAAAGDVAALERLVRRRLSGEPLAWITGATDFCGQRVVVTPGVYVQRVVPLSTEQAADKRIERRTVRSGQ